MTTAPHEAAGDALRDVLAAEIADILLEGGSLSPRQFASRLVARPLAPVLATRATAEAERDAAREEADIVRDDSAAQMRMLDSIAAALGLAHDEGLDDAGPFLARVASLTAERDGLKAALVALSRVVDEGRLKADAPAQAAFDLALKLPEAPDAP